MLQLFTARVSYAGRDRLDITRKSGCQLGIVFAPSLSLLGPILIERREFGFVCAKTWERYQQEYREEMLESYSRNPDDWRDLLSQPEATLCCYCSAGPDGLRCHRTLLAGYLTRLGAKYHGERLPAQTAMSFPVL